MALALPKTNFPSSINFDLLKAKFFYFFFITGMVTLLPYLYLYYKHVLFLSPIQVTVLVAVRPLCLIIGAPLLGTIADKTNRFKTVILICLGSYIVTYGFLTFLEPVDGFNCADVIAARAAQKDNISFIKNSSKEFLFLKALKKNVDYFYPGREIEDSWYSWPFSRNAYDATSHITKNLFVTVLGVTFVGELLSAPAYTFADVYTLQMLEDQTHRYGYQILPGVIGTGIVSVLMLLLTHAKIMNIQSFCDKSMILADKPYLIQFLICMGLSLAVASLFQYHLNKPLKREKSSAGGLLCGGCKLLETLRMVIKNRFHASFMLIVLMCGIADGAKTSFTYTYIADLGNDKNRLHNLPLITATHFLSHVVFLAISPYILKRFGHIRVITSGVLVYALSFIVYGIINDPALVFIVEPFDGVARQLARIAIITFVGSPSGVGAALQGITHSIYLGMGTSIGSFICGYLVHKYGYVLVFVLMGVMCLIGFGFCLAVDHFWPMEKTIAEAFMTYSMVVSDDNESDFDFLLRDFGGNDPKETETESKNENDVGSRNEKVTDLLKQE